MKKTISCILALCLVFSALSVSAAENKTITVTVNGDVLQTDTAPIIENDRILLPMRAVFESLGCTVAYRTENSKQYVSATHGEDQIFLEIGKNEIGINDEVKSLDVAAKIVNNRTMVPLRAVSEALGAEVSWNGETKTAAVALQQGTHKIRSVAGEKTIKASDGTELIYVNYVYPIIDNKEQNEYINKINSDYKTFAEKFVQSAEEETSSANDLLIEMGKDAYRPMEYNLSYSVHVDKNNILSITNYAYYNLGGAHPNTERTSENFDLQNEKELTLSDVMNGSADEIHTVIYNKFVKYFEESDEHIAEDIADALDKECGNVHFYLTDSAAVLYFDVYQIAPYAAGYPTIELPYSETDFKLNLSANGAK